MKRNNNHFCNWNDLQPQEIAANYRRQVAVGENVTVARVEVKQGAVTAAHSHPNEEIIVVLRGAWRFNLPSGKVTVTPNQTLLIPPGIEHSSEAIEDTVALDICAPARRDWLTGDDEVLHNDPDQFLWAV